MSTDNVTYGSADGTTVLIDFDAYKFVDGKAPPTVNPSLWRQAKLNNIHGLFEVTKGVYQLRGFDLANISLIQGKTGWILVDPLTTAPTARNALAFAREQLGEQKISAIIFTHSHIDHFGGIGDLDMLQLDAVAPEFIGAMLKNADLLARKVEVGMLWVNMPAMPSAEMPFGGIKDSGYGSEGGPEAMDAYLNVRAVTVMNV